MENGGRWAVKHKYVMTLEMTGIFGVRGGLVVFFGGGRMLNYGCPNRIRYLANTMYISNDWD